MAYTKRTWKYEGQSGAIPISPANLNHIEDGIAAVDTGKADKVSGATNNNFASLDGNGNLKDSGKKATDFEDSGAVSTHNSDATAHTAIRAMPYLPKRYDGQGTSADLDTITDGSFFVGTGNSNWGALRDVIGGEYAYITQYFYHAVGTANYRVQVAMSYTNNKMAIRRFHSSVWSDWKEIFTAVSTIPIENGGTGQTTVAGARNALGLGNTSGAVPIANGGTGSTTAANARTALGIRTFSGNCRIVTSGNNYGTVTISGVTASSIIVGVVSGAQVANGWRINSITAGANQATVYFGLNSSVANFDVAVRLIAIG